MHFNVCLLSLLIFKMVLMTCILAQMKVYFPLLFAEWRIWMSKSVIKCWLKCKHRYWIWFMRKCSHFRANECLFAQLIAISRKWLRIFSWWTVNWGVLVTELTSPQRKVCGPPGKWTQVSKQTNKRTNLHTSYFFKIAHMSMVWTYVSLWLCVFGFLLQEPIRLKVLYNPRNDPQPWNNPQIDPEMIPTPKWSPFNFRNGMIS